jgi:type VI secretion system protein ImpL
MGVLTLALAVGWAISRSNNLDHASQVAAKLPAIKQAVAGLPPPSSADVSPLAQPLAQLRDAAQVEELDLDKPPLLHGLGLYQGDKLDAGAQIAYQRLLDKTLVPRVTRRLEEQLRATARDLYAAIAELARLRSALAERERLAAGLPGIGPGIVTPGDVAL